MRWAMNVFFTKNFQVRYLHNLQLRSHLLFRIATTLLAFVFCNLTCNYVVIFFFKLHLSCSTQLAITLSSSCSNCNYVVGFRNLACNYVVVFFFKLQLSCLTQLAITFSSSFSNCNYVVGFCNLACNYVVIFFFKLQLRC